MVHIVGATTYALAGILQFRPRFRGRHRAWHRRAGRVLAAAGLLVAISALWMTLLYQAQPGAGELRGDLARGAGWVINLAVAEWAIRRPAVRRTSQHPGSTPAGAPS